MDEHPREEKQEESALASLLPPALALLIALGLWYWISGAIQPPPRGTEHAAVGTALTRLQLEPLTGDTSDPFSDVDPTVTMAAVRGKVALINYWGPWCGFCRLEFPHLVKLEERYRDNPGFTFLPVTCSGGPNEDVVKLQQSAEEYLAQFESPPATYADPDNVSQWSLMQSAGIESFGFPTTVVLDRNGVIQGVWQGFADGWEKEIEAEVARLLK